MKEEEKKKYVSFTVAKHKYGLSSKFVIECIRSVKISSIPESPPHIEGVVNIRGTLVPVLNLQVLNGLAKEDLKLTDFFVLLKYKEISFAIICHEFNGIIDISQTKAEEKSESISFSKNIRKILNTGDSLLFILDLDELIKKVEEIKTV